GGLTAMTHPTSAENTLPRPSLHGASQKTPTECTLGCLRPITLRITRRRQTTNHSNNRKFAARRASVGYPE
ncbi:MAG: hypothetical protein AAF802_30285, partial [Planctomycetota bacterium]